MRSRYSAYVLNRVDYATVEFVARCKQSGRASRLHEISRFEKLSGCWLLFTGCSDRDSV
jgi:uncharacterized protein YchJ